MIWLIEALSIIALALIIIIMVRKVVEDFNLD
jgi:hypothetical protein